MFTCQKEQTFLMQLQSGKGGSKGREFCYVPLTLIQAGQLRAAVSPCFVVHLCVPTGIHGAEGRGQHMLNEEKLQGKQLVLKKKERVYWP